MKFYVFHLMQAPTSVPDAEVYRQEADLMVRAEELGFDAVWIAEHHFHHYCITPDPLLLATHVAARTKRIRIGTAANVVTFIHPLRIAEQAAMLDNLSGGRVDIGLAKGYGPREFAGYGVDQMQAKERQLEAIDIVVGALTTDGFSFHGKHFQVPYPVTIRPRPVQKPPRMYVATGGTADTLELAGRKGLSYYTAYQGRKKFREHREIYVNAARAAGRSEAEISALANACAVMQNSYVTPTSGESYEDARAPVDFLSEVTLSVNRPEHPELLNEGVQKIVKTALERPDRGYQRYDDYWKAFLFGDPAMLVEKVGRLKETGFENIIVGFSFGGLPYDKVRSSMRLFAEKVMPRFK